MNLIRNKKGDFESIIYTIVIIFVAGFILLILNSLFYQVDTGLKDAFQNSSTDIKVGNATEAITEIRDVEANAWDYGFLFIVIGYVLSIGLFSFYQQSNPLFFWINIIMSSFGILLGIGLGYAWNQIAETPELAETIARFPITNALLGTYYPIIILFVIVLTLILFYGKDSSGGIQ